MTSPQPSTSITNVITMNASKPNHVFDGFHPNGLFPLRWGPKKAAKPSPKAIGKMQKMDSKRFQKKSVAREMQMP